jgi:hypothetical protein
MFNSLHNVDRNTQEIFKLHVQLDFFKKLILG